MGPEHVTWKARPSESAEVARRLAHCEALIAQVTTGMVILEPGSDDDATSLHITMVNQLASCYFGSIGMTSDPISETERGLRESGIYDLAVMVSLTGKQHFQESVPAWAPFVAGQRLDLAITPLGEGVVSITFEDVTHQGQI